MLRYQQPQPTSPPENIVTMAPPPLVQNHAETLLLLVVYWQIKYCQIAEVSAH
jgi:hypothetical protein